MLDPESVTLTQSNTCKSRMATEVKVEAPVATAEAKAAATETCRAELQRVHDELARCESREQKIARLQELKRTLHPETLYFLRVTQQREEEHRDFMEVLIPQVQELQGRKPPPHDHSKDEMFFFAAPSFFDGKCTGPDATKLKDDELARHYRMEPHHPEWELYHEGKECSWHDVVEMAIDRLARNVQFGDSTVHMDVLRKFVPKFPRGDNEKKQAIFLEHVEKYKDLVEREFIKMYPLAKAWAPSSK